MLPTLDQPCRASRCHSRNGRRTEPEECRGPPSELTRAALAQDFLARLSAPTLCKLLRGLVLDA
jgi:hypothetical protein